MSFRSNRSSVPAAAPRQAVRRFSFDELARQDTSSAAGLLLNGKAFGLSGGGGELVEGSDEIAYRADMATNVERLAEQALKLPSESRARLADLLVESLDADELGRIDQLWTAEAKRRRDEVRSGRVKTVPAEQARRRVRDLLKR